MLRRPAFARPKSSTLTMPSRVIAMLAGLRSRWTMPFSCAASSASAICRAMASASRDRQRGRSVEPLGKRLALDELEDQRVNAVAVLEPVDGADVRMIQRREQPCFALESRAPIGIRRESVRQNLDRHRRGRAWCRARGRLRPCRPRRAGRRSRTTQPPADDHGPSDRAGAAAGTMCRSPGVVRNAWAAPRIGEERLDFAPQRLVGAACLAQKRRALAFVARERGVVQPLDSWPELRTDHTSALTLLIGKGRGVLEWPGD